MSEWIERFIERHVGVQNGKQVSRCSLQLGCLLHAQHAGYAGPRIVRGTSGVMPCGVSTFAGPIDLLLYRDRIDCAMIIIMMAACCQWSIISRMTWRKEDPTSGAVVTDRQSPDVCNGFNARANSFDTTASLSLRMRNCLPVVSC